jgi:hypothetical protein
MLCTGCCNRAGSAPAAAAATKPATAAVPAVPAMAILTRKRGPRPELAARTGSPARSAAAGSSAVCALT